MNTTIQPANGKVRIGFAPITINNGEIQNPLSRRVILAMKDGFGRPGFIFPSLEEAYTRKPVAGTVALVDMKDVEQLMLNSDEQQFEERIPLWAKEPMSNLYFGICLSGDVQRIKFWKKTRCIILPIDVRSALLAETARFIIDYCASIFPEDEPLLGSRERAEREWRADIRQGLIRQETDRKNKRRMKFRPIRGELIRAVS